MYYAYGSDTPPFRDIGLPNGEKATYLIKESSNSILTDHLISIQMIEEGEVYVVRTDTMEMVLRRGDLRPVYIKKVNEKGELEFLIRYRPGRVHFIYPGPKRNKVAKIPTYSYDLNTMLEVIRCFPFERGKVKFTLVTPDHVLKAYARVKGHEKVRTPLGEFRCYLIEGGISGLMGRIIRKKFLFWVEEEYPHRLLKFKDDQREITLVGYE